MCWRAQSAPSRRGASRCGRGRERTASGERAVDVDQTNESVIVGDAAVVKWATHLQEGPHPAPRRIAVLREAGFAGMPTPWGLVTWRPADGAETLVASVDEYLPGAVDGWTWAVDLITDAARKRHRLRRPAVEPHEVGSLVAELHAALAGTATVALGPDAHAVARRRASTLETVCGCPIARASRSPAPAETRSRQCWTASVRSRARRSSRGTATCTSVRYCCATGRFVVTDFDGNPVLPAPRADAADSRGPRRRRHGAVAGTRRDRRAQVHRPRRRGPRRRRHAASGTAFLDAYTDRNSQLGRRPTSTTPMRSAAFRMQQVLREIVYAAKHLPRWMYVPDAALPALLDEGAPS